MRGGERVCEGRGGGGGGEREREREMEGVQNITATPHHISKGECTSYVNLIKSTCTCIHVLCTC